jgi:hypothetical protein
MYPIESLKYKSCAQWFPAVRRSWLNSLSTFQCPSCGQRRDYDHSDLKPRCLPGSPSDSLYRADMRWQRVNGFGLNFFMFVSEANPVVPALHSLWSALEL